MAAGDYGYGVQQDLLPALFLGINGDSTKDRSAQVTLLQKFLQTYRSVGDMVGDPTLAVMSGAYAPQQRQEFVPIQPITDSFLALGQQNSLGKAVIELTSGEIDIPNAVAKVMQDPAAKELARANGFANDAPKYFAGLFSEVMKERRANLSDRRKFEMDFQANDFFAKNGYPQPTETYDLQADPANGVQELPLDQDMLGNFQRILASLGSKKAAGRAFMGEEPTTGLQGPVVGRDPVYSGSNAQGSAAIDGLMNFWKQTQLGNALAQGRTPLKDNILQRANVAALLGGGV